MYDERKSRLLIDLHFPSLLVLFYDMFTVHPSHFPILFVYILDTVVSAPTAVHAHPALSLHPRIPFLCQIHLDTVREPDLARAPERILHAHVLFFADEEVGQASISFFFELFSSALLRVRDAVPS